MPVAAVSSRMLVAADEKRAVTSFGRRVLGGLGPDACEFSNPHEPPLRGLVEALIRHAEPRDVHWFGYQTSDPVAREAVARALRKSRGQPYEAERQMAFGQAKLGLKISTEPPCPHFPQTFIDTYAKVAFALGGRASPKAGRLLRVLTPR